LNFYPSEAAAIFEYLDAALWDMLTVRTEDATVAVGVADFEAITVFEVFDGVGSATALDPFKAAQTAFYVPS
jgi:hypothetical protein